MLSIFVRKLAGIESVSLKKVKTVEDLSTLIEMLRHISDNIYVHLVLILISIKQL